MKLCDLIRNEECRISKEDKMLDIKSISASPESSDASTLLFILNERALLEFTKSKRKFGVAIINENLDFKNKLSSRVRYYCHNNPRLLMAEAYFRFCEIDTEGLKLIGITGTNGKTSTALLTVEILRGAGYRVGFIGTGKIEFDGSSLCDKDYSMTTPDPWVLYPAIKEMQSLGCEIIVMEVSSHALSLDKVAPLHFEYGIFTNVSAEHLDFHGSIDEYYCAKKKLLSMCSNVVFNIDDHYARRAYKEFDGRKISAGILWKGDVWATCIENHGFEGLEYMYRTHSYLFKMRLSLPGIHNIYNSMLATAVCTDLGVKPCVAKRALAAIPALPGRFEIIKSDITVIIDYAHTAFAFESILKEIQRAKLPSEELWVVFGCGGERDSEKRPKIAASAEKYASKVIVTSDNSRGEDTQSIINDIKAGFKGDSYEIIEDRETAIKTAIDKAPCGAVVAIIGKGAEKYNIDKSGYHPFDEKKIAESAIALRKENLRV